VATVVELGSKVSTGVFYWKYNSYNDFTVFFWDDAAATIPTNITGAAVTLEVDTPSGLLTFTGTVGVGQATFSVTSAQSIVTWDDVAFRVILTQSGKRYLTMSGKVRVQK
jgi:hypothetical protein